MIIRGETLGKDTGDYRNRRLPENLLRDLYLRCHAQSVFAPRCDFTTRIEEMIPDDLPPAEPPEGIFTKLFLSAQAADGVVVPDDRRFRLALFNADCPVIAVHDQASARFAVLHGGLRCLVPQAIHRDDAEAKVKRSIVQVLFEDHGFSAKACQAYVGNGIGPCCYGVESHPILLDNGFLDLPLGLTTRGPRYDQRSIDLYYLIELQLLELGVPKSGITVNYACTACANRNGRRINHSHVYDAPNDGRNCTLVWLEPE